MNAQYLCLTAPRCLFYSSSWLWQLNGRNAGYQFTNGIQITVNGLTGDLLANVTDTAVRAGGDNVSIDSIDVSLLPNLFAISTLLANINCSISTLTSSAMLNLKLPKQSVFCHDRFPALMG